MQTSRSHDDPRWKNDGVRVIPGRPRPSRGRGCRWLVAALPAWVLSQALAAGVQIQVQDTAGKPLADAVVFLESREARALVKPMQDAEIAQKAKVFDPAVLVVPLGTSVAFPNRDTVRHHVYSFSAAKNFELKLYSGVPASPVLFDKAGIAVLGCNIHDAMTAWVVVVDTPYFGRSAADGTVVVSAVPPGNYRLRVWHPSLPVGAPAADQALQVGPTDLRQVFALNGARAPCPALRVCGRRPAPPEPIAGREHQQVLRPLGPVVAHRGLVAAAAAVGAGCGVQRGAHQH
jgi:plastocyanin